MQTAVSRALVLSPDPEVQAHLARVCEEIGVEAHAPGVGTGAAKLAARIAPDVCLVDVRTPQRTSWRSNGVPILALGATYETSVIADVIRDGARGYLPIRSSGSQLEWAIGRVVAGELAIPDPLLFDVLQALVVAAARR